MEIPDLAAACITVHWCAARSGWRLLAVVWSIDGGAAGTFVRANVENVIFAILASFFHRDTKATLLEGR
jgi:hypothetical protein